MRIDTAKLLELLVAKRNNTIEACLNNGTFNATHFLRFGGRKVFDCGIDSMEISWDLESFLAFYPEARWRVDQITK